MLCESLFPMVLRRYRLCIPTVLILLLSQRASSDGLPFTFEDIEEVITNIIGGKIAEPGSTPWLVSLKDIKYSHPVHFCGGTILSHYWVLTAAHCILGYEQPYGDVELVVGDYDLEDFDFFWEKRKHILEVVVHPLYNYFIGEYDVALLRVSPSISFNQRVKPLPLPPTNYRGQHTSDTEFVNVDGATDSSTAVASFLSPCSKCPVGQSPFEHDEYKFGYIAGWGSSGKRYVFAHHLTNVIHEAFIPILEKDICRSLYEGIFTEAMMCAGNLTHGGIDPCHGDWGGPLVDSFGYLRGVSSWSVGCGRPSYPAVYVDIFAVRDWICNIID